MPSIEDAVQQATQILDHEAYAPSSSNREAHTGVGPASDLVSSVMDTIQRFPMPGAQSFNDSIRQGDRKDLVPQYRVFPPSQAPSTNVEIVRETVARVAGGGMIVVSSGGSSVVTNLPGAPGAPGLPGEPGSPGTPVGGIPAPPSDTGNLTASDPINVSSVRKVIGGPAIISVDTFGASGPSHKRGVVPDPGAVAGTTRFLREDATWATLPPDDDLEPVTNGDPAFPEIVLSDGDVVMA